MGVGGGEGMMRLVMQTLVGEFCHGVEGKGVTSLPLSGFDMLFWEGGHLWAHLWCFMIRERTVFPTLSLYRRYNYVGFALDSCIDTGTLIILEAFSCCACMHEMISR